MPDKLIFDENFVYKPHFEKISGYVTLFNAVKMGYPFIGSIKSFLNACDEVVVLDGYSTDGTYEILGDLASSDSRIKLYQNEFDMAEPGIDGMQKAFARALCEYSFCLQFDADEAISEDDALKLKAITKRFPRDVDVIHLPVIELWGNENHVTGRRHAWKWRLSKNKPEITHGICSFARLIDEETGKTYAKENMCDGCCYINILTNNPLPHKGFWTSEMEQIRIQDPKQYAILMNQVFSQIPSIFHFSWFSLRNKVNQFGENWNNLWNGLYKTKNKVRFAEKTEDEILSLVKRLYNNGGEDGDQIKYKFSINKNVPKELEHWVDKNRGKYE